MTKLKRHIILIAVALIAYVVSYAVLSYCGGYRLVMSGHARPTGLAFNDTFAWQPRFGVCYPFHTAIGSDTYHMDGLGFLYSPLICLDHSFVHKSRPYITFADDDLDKPQFHPWPPIEQMHPTVRRMIQVIDAVGVRHQAELDAARKRKNFAEVSRIKRKMVDEAEKEFEVQP